MNPGVNNRYRKTDFPMITDLMCKPVAMETSSPDNVTSPVISPREEKHSDVTMTSADADTRRSKKKNADLDRRREFLSNRKRIPIESGIFNIAYAAKEVRVRRTDVFTMDRAKLEKIRQELSTPCDLDALPKRHKSVERRRNTALAPLDTRGQRSRSQYPTKRQELNKEKSAKSNDKKSKGPTSTRRNKSVTDRRSKADSSNGQRANSCNAKDRKALKGVSKSVAPKSRHTADVIANLDASILDTDDIGTRIGLGSTSKRHQSEGPKRNGTLPSLDIQGQRSRSQYPAKRNELSKSTKKSDDKVDKSYGRATARRNKSVTDRRSRADRPNENRARSCGGQERKALKAATNNGGSKKASMAKVLDDLDDSDLDVGDVSPRTKRRNKSVTDRRSRADRAYGLRARSCEGKDRRAALVHATFKAVSTKTISMAEVMEEIDIVDILDMDDENPPVQAKRRTKSLERKSKSADYLSKGLRSKSLIANIRNAAMPDADWLPPGFASKFADGRKKKKKTVHFDLDAPWARIRIKRGKLTVRHTKKSRGRQEKNETRAAAVALAAEDTGQPAFETRLDGHGTKSQGMPYDKGNGQKAGDERSNAHLKHGVVKGDSGLNDKDSHMTSVEKTKLAKMKRDLCIPNGKSGGRYSLPTTRPLDLSRINRNSNFSRLPDKFLPPIKRREEKKTTPVAVDDNAAKKKLKIRHTKKSRDQKTKQLENTSAANDASPDKKLTRKSQPPTNTVPNDEGIAATTKPCGDINKTNVSSEFQDAKLSRKGPKKSLVSDIAGNNQGTRTLNKGTSSERSVRSTRSGLVKHPVSSKRSGVSNRSPSPTPKTRVSLPKHKVRKRVGTADCYASQSSTRTSTVMSCQLAYDESISEDRSLSQASARSWQTPVSQRSSSPRSETSSTIHRSSRQSARSGGSDSTRTTTPMSCSSERHLSSQCRDRRTTVDKRMKSPCRTESISPTSPDSRDCRAQSRASSRASSERRQPKEELGSKSSVSTSRSLTKNGSEGHIPPRLFSPAHGCAKQATDTPSRVSSEMSVNSQPSNTYSLQGTGHMSSARALSSPECMSFRTNPSASSSDTSIGSNMVKLPGDSAHCTTRSLSARRKSSNANVDRRPGTATATPNKPSASGRLSVASPTTARADSSARSTRSHTSVNDSHNDPVVSSSKLSVSSSRHSSMSRRSERSVTRISSASSVESYSDRSTTRSLSVTRKSSNASIDRRPQTATASPSRSSTSGCQSVASQTSARSDSSAKSARSHKSGNGNLTDPVVSASKPPVSPSRNCSGTPCTARSARSVESYSAVGKTPPLSVQRKPSNASVDSRARSATASPCKSSTSGRQSVTSLTSARSYSSAKSARSHTSVNSSLNDPVASSSTITVSPRRNSCMTRQAERSVSRIPSARSVESSASPQSTRSTSSLKSISKVVRSTAGGSISKLMDIDSLPPFGQESTNVNPKMPERPTSAAVSGTRIGTAKSATGRRPAM